MKRIKLTVAYDGSDYYGFQRLNKLPTIQNELEKGLKNMTSIPHFVFGASRTDKGVHAKAQVVHFDTKITEITTDTWIKGLNKRLPSDIRVVKAEVVSKNFHARHSVKSKKYEYRISKNESTPFTARYEVYYENLNWDIIKQVYKQLEGTHDFVGFAKYVEGKPTIKNLYQVNLRETKNHYIFTFHGDNFLRYMIRSMMGTLIEMAIGRKPIDTIEKIFTTNNRKLAGKTAPAKGLTLVKMFY